jgi:hypothetical protein
LTNFRVLNVFAIDSSRHQLWVLPNILTIFVTKARVEYRVTGR